MVFRNSDRLATLRKSFGSIGPPKIITQGIFEAGPEHLERLASLTAGERADPFDLCEYMYDLQYRTDTQVELFTYLLPFCLDGWAEYLSREDFECPGFAQRLYTVIEEENLFEELLTPEQGRAVGEFMCGSILDEIDAQTDLHFEGYPSPPYRWIHALTSQGAITSGIESLWAEWWSMSTNGRAAAAVQYISCLMYPKAENPIFAPYTKENGGGPPCLWEFSGFRSAGWRQTNVEFLQKLMDDRGAVRTALERAVRQLSEHPQHHIADQVLRDLSRLNEILARRCGVLPYMLANPDEFDWTSSWPDWATQNGAS